MYDMLDHQGVEELIIYWLDHNELRRHTTTEYSYPLYQNDITGADKVDMAGLTTETVYWRTLGDIVEMFAEYNRDSVVSHYTNLGYEFLGEYKFGLYFLYEVKHNLLPGSKEKLYALLSFDEGHTHVSVIPGNELDQARAALEKQEPQVDSGLKEWFESTDILFDSLTDEDLGDLM